MNLRGIIKATICLLIAIIVLVAGAGWAQTIQTSGKKIHVHEQMFDNEQIFSKNAGMGLMNYGSPPFDNTNYYYAAVKTAPSGVWYRQAGLSPNGQKIVAGKQYTDGSIIRREVVLMNADGTDEIIISPGNSGEGDIYQYGNPFWSDDGTVIGFAEVHNTNPNKIVRYVVSSSTSSYIYEPVTPLDACNADFVGNSTTSIVFWDWISADGAADLFIWDGTTRTNITNSTNYSEYEPVSNSDGTVILYWSGETTTEPVNTTHTLTYSGGVWTKDVGFTPITDSYWPYWSSRSDNYIGVTVMSSGDVHVYSSTGIFVFDLTGPGYSGGSGQWNFIGFAFEGPNGEIVATSNAGRIDPGRDIIFAAPRTKLFVASTGSDSYPGTLNAPFLTINKGVTEAISGGSVNVAPGTYEEQVVITKSNLTITGAGAGPDPATHTIVKSPVALTWFFTTSANNYPVMGINGATGVQIKNLRVDGTGRGNSNYRFVGIGFWNSDGSVIDCEITGIRDTPFSGAQHGNGIYSYNNAGGPYTINVSGTEIDDFQKNGMTLSGNNLTVNVLNCTVMGKGLTSVTAQNGIQIGYGTGGTVTNCSVSDIGYIPATSWVASGMIFLNGTIVNVSGTSSVSGSQVSIVFQETQGSVDGVNITSADIDAAEGISIRDYGYSRFKGNPGKISAISLSPFEEEWEVESKLLSIPTTVTINNATLTGVHHVGSYGVATWSLGDDVNLTLTNSDIQDWEIGIVAYESGSKVNVTANHNTISSNEMGFWTNAALIQNAVSNWWGDASGPYHNATNAGAMGNEVTDYVDYSPWWGANYVGDSHATPWTWYVNTSNNSTIQEGIDLASSGDVVRARPGTYNENININKPLALLGVGQDSVLVYPAISDIGQPNPELGPSFRGSQICVVQAPNVTIDGFTFDGDSPTLTPLGTLDARNGIITNYSLGDWSNLKVQNCTVKNIYLRGIYASAKNPNNLTGVDFNHNTVSNVKSVSMQSAGIMLWGSSGNVKHNDVSDASLGIFYHWYSDGNIDSNTVTTSEVCLGTNSNDAATSISYNTVTNSAQGIQTVYILAPVNVAFNNVTACTSGVVLYGGGSAQNNVWDNNIIGLGYYSTYGFWGSTDPYGALSANLKRNTIKDNFYGMVLNEAHGDNAALLSVLIGGAPADHNFVYDNTNYELLLEYCNDNQTATYNYWGKSLYTQIEEEIYHKVDQPDLGLVTFDPAILLGDVNLDGQVSVSDIVYLINYLFKGGPAPQIFILADVNGDGKVSVSDVIYLINYLFKGGSAPIALSSGLSKPVMEKPLIEKLKLSRPVSLHSIEK